MNDWSMEHRWTDTDEAKPKYLEKTHYQYHIFQKMVISKGFIRRL